MKERVIVSLPQFIKELDSIAYSAGRHVQQVFRDWLQMIVCALSMQSMEDTYMETVKHYADKGLAKRLSQLFGALVQVMEGRKDMLGDIFMEAVSRGNNGQFFTPTEVCRLMAQMTGVPHDGASVYDPACGSGRCLLAMAEINPRCVLVGQDNDMTCVQMLAVNLALNGLQGYAVHGNTLTNEIWKVYKIGMPGVPGVIYQVSYQYFQAQFTKGGEQHEEAIKKIESHHREEKRLDQARDADDKRRVGGDGVRHPRRTKQSEDRTQHDELTTVVQNAEESPNRSKPAILTQQPTLFDM